MASPIRIEPTAPAAPVTQPRRFWRSTGAILLGLLAVVILSLVTDQLMNALKVFPPSDKISGDNMRDTHYLLALAYRTVYSVAGSYIAARFAPHAPMRHALILGFIGLVLCALGVVGAISGHMGYLWYPIALVVLALPSAWLGGYLYRAPHTEPKE